MYPNKQLPREQQRTFAALRSGAVQEICGEIWNGAPEMCHEGKWSLGNATKGWQRREEAPGGGSDVVSSE